MRRISHTQWTKKKKKINNKRTSGRVDRVRPTIANARNAQNVDRWFLEKHQRLARGFFQNQIWTRNQARQRMANANATYRKQNNARSRKILLLSNRRWPTCHLLNGSLISTGQSAIITDIAVMVNDNVSLCSGSRNQQPCRCTHQTGATAWVQDCVLRVYGYLQWLRRGVWATEPFLLHNNKFKCNAITVISWIRHNPTLAKSLAQFWFRSPESAGEKGLTCTITLLNDF